MFTSSASVELIAVSSVLRSSTPSHLLPTVRRPLVSEQFCPRLVSDSTFEQWESDRFLRCNGQYGSQGFVIEIMLDGDIRSALSVESQPTMSGMLGSPSLTSLFRLPLCARETVVVPFFVCYREARQGIVHSGLFVVVWLACVLSHEFNAQGGPQRLKRAFKGGVTVPFPTMISRQHTQLNDSIRQREDSQRQL
jgi:hypothetical protein